MLDRLITTKMSAKIVATALKRGSTVDEIAQQIKAPSSFARGVQAKQQVLTMKDIRAIAKQLSESPYVLLFNSIPASEMKPELKELFASTRSVLEASAACGTTTRSTTAKKRRNRSRAA